MAPKIQPGAQRGVITELRGGRAFLDGRFVPVGKITLGGGKVVSIDTEAARPAVGPHEVRHVEDVLEIGEDVLILPGLIDGHVHLREPGYEHKETVETGTRAALAGGFTTVFAMPNTDPPPDDVDHWETVSSLLCGGAVDIFPVASATIGRLGRQLVDVPALFDKGARVFSDDGDAIENPALLRELLGLSAKMGFLVSDHCEDPRLSGKRPLHQGAVAKHLGLDGQPPSAETLQLAKGIVLAAETQGRYHAQHLSAAHSVELVRWARSEGWDVTGEVTVHHLFFTQEVVLKAHSDAKCAPPLRTEDDRRALLDGCIDGTISAIVTDHAPHTSEEKTQDLEESPFGVIGLETAVSALHTLGERGELPFERAVHLLTEGPAERFGLPDRGRLASGLRADITLFDPGLEWTVRPPFFSKSRNTPFIAERLKGRVIGVLCRGELSHVLP